jgi:hypothetical protein
MNRSDTAGFNVLLQRRFVTLIRFDTTPPQFPKRTAGDIRADHSISAAQVFQKREPGSAAATVVEERLVSGRHKPDDLLKLSPRDGSSEFAHDETSLFITLETLVCVRVIARNVFRIGTVPQVHETTATATHKSKSQRSKCLREFVGQFFVSERACHGLPFA